MKNYVWVILFLLAGWKMASGQASCVDAEFEGVYSQYPKTIGSTSYAWNGSAWNVPVMKQKKITGKNISGNMFNGLLEYTPAGYNPADASTKYPVILFFHGYASRGAGTVNQLCRILKDMGSDLATHKSLPGRIENNSGEFTPTINGTTFKYIVISPQFTKYLRPADESQPHDFPSADAVSDMIDYVVANYNVDESRIYLTGLSNGANMVMEYAASSVSRARRVAAIMPVSLCSTIGSLRNSERGYVPANIASAGLPVWFVQCETDVPCGKTAPQEWYDAIKAAPGGVTPRYTLLRDANANPLYQCSDTLLHDAWSRAYDPSFTASYVNGNGANDGVNMNMYRWFAQQTSNAVLPVNVKNFRLRLINDQVEIRWITTDEKDNDHFSIERAGYDLLFSLIGKVPGAKFVSGEQEYAFLDETPLSFMNYYRLVQTDRDGRKTYYDIKRILVNRDDERSALTVTPNPFGERVSAFLFLSAPERVTVTVSDMTGKIVRRMNVQYPAGNTEIKLGSMGLSKGLYLLNVTGKSINLSQKIIRR